MLRRLAVLLTGALFAAGCDVTTEVGAPCVLVKQASQEEQERGIRAVPMLESELVPGQDYISFGSLDCLDQICVRDPAFVSNAGPNEPARGYCSAICSPETVEERCRITRGDAPEGLEGRMACRSLLLDEETLRTLRSIDPAFAKTSSSTYCAGAPPEPAAG